MIRINDEPAAWQPGLTVAGLVVREGFEPAIVAVWINEEFIARSQIDRTPVPDDSAVVIVLMVPGG